MKRPFYIIVLITLGLFLLFAFCLYFAGHKHFAKFLLELLTSFSVIAAIVAALFGDVLKEHVQLSIDKPPIENDKSKLDEFEIKDENGNIQKTKVYCHHLVVKNEKPYLVVKNCRVWLISMEDYVSGKWEKIQFAVPRLMEWAPNEYSEVCGHCMSFSDFQIFDFGKTFVETTGDFELHKYKKQGGKLDLSCKGGHRKKYIFRITVDNYAIPEQQY